MAIYQQQTRFTPWTYEELSRVPMAEAKRDVTGYALAKSLENMDVRALNEEDKAELEGVVGGYQSKVGTLAQDIASGKPLDEDLMTKFSTLTKQYKDVNQTLLDYDKQRQSAYSSILQGEQEHKDWDPKVKQEATQKVLSQRLFENNKVGSASGFYLPQFYQHDKEINEAFQNLGHTLSGGQYGREKIYTSQDLSDPEKVRKMSDNTKALLQSGNGSIVSQSENGNTRILNNKEQREAAVEQIVNKYKTDPSRKEFAEFKFGDNWEDTLKSLANQESTIHKVFEKTTDYAPDSKLMARGDKEKSFSPLEMDALVSGVKETKVKEEIDNAKNLLYSDVGNGKAYSNLNQKISKLHSEASKTDAEIAREAKQWKLSSPGGRQISGNEESVYVRTLKINREVAKREADKLKSSIPSYYLDKYTISEGTNYALAAGEYLNERQELSQLVTKDKILRDGDAFSGVVKSYGDWYSPDEDDDETETKKGSKIEQAKIKASSNVAMDFHNGRYVSKNGKDEYVKYPTETEAPLFKAVKLVEESLLTGKNADKGEVVINTKIPLPFQSNEASYFAGWGYDKNGRYFIDENKAKHYNLYGQPLTASTIYNLAEEGAAQALANQNTVESKTRKTIAE